MRIHVRSKQVEVDETVRAHIEHRIEMSLGRLSSRIQRVNAQIIDLNGPRGGRDKACRIELRLLPTGSIFVEDTDADLYVAVGRAADRAARSASRAIERTRDLERDATPPSSPLPAPAAPDTDQEPTV
jgi:ribosomal subunit interface protein